MRKALRPIALAAAAHIFTCWDAPAEEARTMVDGTGAKVAVPLHPQRIVALHDTALTVPLLELGIVPVGSHGRVAGDGMPFIRSGLELTGYDFANSEIAFVGDEPADLEKIAMLEPDLILTTSWQAAHAEQLRAIAPTYVFDFNAIASNFHIYEILAEVLGAESRLKTLKARYDAQIAMVRELVSDPSEISVSVVQPAHGQLQVWNTYFGLGKVLRDTGFSFPAAVNAIEGSEPATFSAEMLPELDADFIFITYPLRAFGWTPGDTAKAMADVLPDWCDVLHACRAGQVIYLPRSVASSTTYEGLSQMSQAVASHIVGRAFTPIGK